MVEQLMKMGTLATDCRFILMVEDTNTGTRRIAGDNYLVKHFAQGTLKPKDDDLRLELDPNAVTGIYEQGLTTIFELDEQTNGKRAGAYMDNEFGTNKKAKTDTGHEEPDDECNIFVDKLPATFTEEDFRGCFAPFGTIARVKLLVDKKTNVSKCNGFILFTTAQAADSAISEMNGKVLDDNGPSLYVRKAKDNKNKNKGGAESLLSNWPGLQAMAVPAIMAMATGKKPSDYGYAEPYNSASVAELGMMSSMQNMMSGMSSMNSGGYGMGGYGTGMSGGMGGGSSGGGMGNGSSSTNNPYAGYTAQGTPGVEGVTKHTLFVYNLSPDTAELDLYNLFGKFGAIIDVHVQRDNATGAGKGFAFVSFAEYSQATAAIQAMDGYLYEKNNYKPLQVSFKNQKKN